MNCFYKKFLVRTLALLCSVILLFLSLCVKYMDAAYIGKVHAAEVVLAGEGVAYAVELLIALLATVGLGSAAYDNRDAIAASYKEYVEAQINTERLLIDSAEDVCIQVYNKIDGSMQSIPWEVLLNSLQEGYDTAVDGLTGVYARYCPQLLGSFDDFVADILDGDVYVQGVSDAVVEYADVTESDMDTQLSGELFTYGWHTHFSSTFYSYSNETYPFIDDLTYSVPSTYRTAGYYLPTNTNTVTLDEHSTATEYFVDFRISAYDPDNPRKGIFTPPEYAIRTRIVKGKTACYNVASWVSSASWYDRKIKAGHFNGSFTASANFPIFEDEVSAYNYLRTGEGYECAINYGKSIYDNITDNIDLPTFHNKWQQELWERVINAPDIITIGSYGHGVLDDNWGDDIPWIALDYLQEYSISLLDIYHQIIDDVINGTYMSDRGVPKTYSDAWDAAITDAWSDVTDKSEVAGEGGEDDNSSESWYNEDGSINYPPNNGAVPGTEKPVTLKPGDVVGRYGKPQKSSTFVTQPGADPDSLSLPPTTDSSIYQEYVVEKDIADVIQSEILPWGGSSGGGIQYKLPIPILELIIQEYLRELK